MCVTQGGMDYIKDSEQQASRAFGCLDSDVYTAKWGTGVFGGWGGAPCRGHRGYFCGRSGVWVWDRQELCVWGNLWLCVGKCIIFFKSF